MLLILLLLPLFYFPSDQLLDKSVLDFEYDGELTLGMPFMEHTRSVGS